MRIFFITFFKFVLFASVFYILMIILWGEFSPVKKNLRYRIKPDGHTFSRLKELRSTQDIDLLFLGSSHTYRGFDNRIFKKVGYSSFNMGSNSQTPLQTEYLLENYLDSLRPKFVIYEVCPFVFSLDGVESSLEIIANDEIQDNSFELTFKQNHLKVYNAMIFTFYRRLFFNDIETTKEGFKNNNDTYISGGFVDIKMMYYNKEKFDNQHWLKDPKQFASFENIMHMLEERNIEIILVQAPVTTDLYNSYDNNPEFDMLMKGYAEYYNFNETLQLTDSIHFFDFHHLNRNGLEVFNNSMLDIVSKKDQ